MDVASGFASSFSEWWAFTWSDWMVQIAEIVCGVGRQHCLLYSSSSLTLEKTVETMVSFSEAQCKLPTIEYCLSLTYFQTMSDKPSRRICCTIWDCTAEEGTVTRAQWS